MHRFLVHCLIVCAGLLLLGVGLRAQDAEKSALIRFVEEQLSAPNRQISLNGLDGALSSDVVLESITIADQQGIWLRIENPRLVWTRSALLGGRLAIDELSAERIDFIRKPLADESLPSPEAQPLSIPELPIAVELERLSVPVIAFGAEVFGLQSEASLDARMILSGGSLDLALDIDRLGDVPGTLDADVRYDAAGPRLALDVTVSEAQNGMIANALGLPGTPPVALTVAGDAPLEELTVSLDLDVDSRAVLDGRLAFSRSEDNLLARLDAEGPIATLFRDDVQQVLGDDTRLAADVVYAEDGAVSITGFEANSGAFSVSGAAGLAPDGFLTRLVVDLALNDPSGRRIVLPSEADPVSLDRLALAVRYDTDQADAWSALLSVTEARSGDLSIGALSLSGDGAARNIRRPEARSVSFRLSGRAEGFRTDDPALAQALGERVDLSASGDWATGMPLRLADLTVTGNDVTVRASGTFADNAFDGEARVAAGDLSLFAPFAGQDLAGALDVALRGRVEPLSGAFDVTADGTTRNLAIGNASVDPLFVDETVLSGGIARTTEGLAFDDFRLEATGLQVTANGRFASDTADLTATALLRDVGLIRENSSGAVQVTASVRGDATPFETNLDVSMPSGQLIGRSVQDLALLLAGRADGQRFDGALSSRGFFDRAAVILGGDIAIADGGFRITGLAAELAGLSLAGDVAQGADGLFDGNLRLDARDIAPAAALALVDASGSASGSVTLVPEAGQQTVSAELAAQALRFQDVTLGRADLTARIADAFGVPAIDATLEGGNGRVAGFDMRTLSARAGTSGDRTDFDLDARLRAVGETAVALNGFLVREAGGTTSITLEQVQADTAIVDARLSEPATITVGPDETVIAPAVLTIGSGSVRIGGRVGDQLDLEAALSNLPLRFANAFVSDLGLAGTLSGTLDVAGTADKPSGTFSLTGDGLTARPLSEARLTPLSLSADGRLAGSLLDLTSANVRNGQGLSLSASGAVPFSGRGLNVSVNGDAPLALARPFVVERGTTLEGRARLQANATGSIANPRINGSVAVAGGAVTDPLSNVRLRDVTLNAALQDDVITISRGSARLVRGGSIALGGRLGLTGDLPAAMTLDLQRAAYSDGELVRAIASGRLTMTGPVLRDLLVAGTVTLEELEITVPETFGSGPELLDVDHVAPDRATRETLGRLARTSPSAGSSGTGRVRLDIEVIADRRIFVRGRGLDAELGGRLRLRGPTTAIEPEGGFTLRRGRLDVIGRRITLESGQVTFAGDLDPVLAFVARTNTSDAVAFINLSGRVSDLEVSFSSSPELPEDEVLALIIFDRGINELSPVQIARLAAAAAELAGGGNANVVGSLRSGIGLDDLDVVEDDDGGAAVRAGKYISDNVYVGVQAGRETEANINLDITDDLTVRGSVETDGDTSLGIFFERDY